MTEITTIDIGAANIVRVYISKIGKSLLYIYLPKQQPIFVDD